MNHHLNGREWNCFWNPQPASNKFCQAPLQSLCDFVDCHLHTKKKNTSQVIHKQFLILNNFAYNQLFSSTMSWSLAALSHSLTFCGVFNIGVIFFLLLLFIKMHIKSHLYIFLDQLLHSPMSRAPRNFNLTKKTLKFCNRLDLYDHEPEKNNHPIMLLYLLNRP